MSNLTLIPQATTTAVVPASGLSALQAAYALYRSGGEFYVIDLQKIADIKTGNCAEVEYFKSKTLKFC